MMDLVLIKKEIEERLSGYSSRIERNGIRCTLNFEFNDDECEVCGIDDERLECFYGDVTVRPVGEEGGYELGICVECPGGEVDEAEYGRELSELDRLAEEFISALDAAEDAKAYVKEMIAKQEAEAEAVKAELQQILDRTNRRSVIAAVAGVCVLAVIAVLIAVLGG